MIEVFSPAKINLALHVTGQRDDGYHTLDSLVCFPKIGDRLTFSPASQTELHVHSMGQPVPTDRSNLILRMAALVVPNDALRIDLYKDLPVAGGIGGGSANAGATMRAATPLTQGAFQPDKNIVQKLLEIGADIPACFFSLPLRMAGIGEQIEPVREFPKTGYLVLVNPGVSTPTPAVFKALMNKINRPMPKELPLLDTFESLVSFVREQRNDLQEVAISQTPEIKDVLTSLNLQEGCAFARMSGSGATCFGLFAKHDHATQAVDQIRMEHPTWWASFGDLSCKFDETTPKGQFKRATT